MITRKVDGMKFEKNDVMVNGEKITSVTQAATNGNFSIFVIVEITGVKIDGLEIISNTGG